MKFHFLTAPLHKGFISPLTGKPCRNPYFANKNENFCYELGGYYHLLPGGPHHRRFHEYGLQLDFLRHCTRTGPCTDDGLQSTYGQLQNLKDFRGLLRRPAHWQGRIRGSYLVAFRGGQHQHRNACMEGDLFHHRFAQPLIHQMVFIADHDKHIDGFLL